MKGFSRFLAAATLTALAFAPAVPALAQVPAPRGQAEVELPDTPPGRRTAEVLRLVAEGNDAEARAYVERRHDGARVRGLLRDLYRAHGAAPASWPLASGAWKPSVPAGWSGAPRLPGERAPEGTDPGTPSGGFG